jgi:hypothetical protein
VARQDAIGATNAKNQTTLQTAQIKAQTAQEAAAAKAAQTDFQNRLAFTRTYHYDPMTKQPQAGWEVGPNGTVVKITKGPTAKTLSGGQTITFLKGLASTKRVPELDANGNTQLDSNNKVRYTTQTQFRMPYEQAYQQLISAGKTDAQARRALDTIYPKGQGGRSWLTNTQQSVLSNAGTATATGVIDINNVGERHYITQAQAKALKAAKSLPPGFWYTADQGHSVYVIKPGY